MLEPNEFVKSMEQTLVTSATVEVAGHQLKIRFTYTLYCGGYMEKEMELTPALRKKLGGYEHDADLFESSEAWEWLRDLAEELDLSAIYEQSVGEAAYDTMLSAVRIDDLTTGQVYHYDF